MKEEGLFYNDVALDWPRKHEKEDFEELVYLVTLCPGMCIFPMKL